MKVAVITIGWLCVTVARPTEAWAIWLNSGPHEVESWGAKWYGSNGEMPLLYIHAGDWLSDSEGRYLICSYSHPIDDRLIQFPRVGFQVTDFLPTVVALCLRFGLSLWKFKRINIYIDSIYYVRNNCMLQNIIQLLSLFLYIKLDF